MVETRKQVLQKDENKKANRHKCRNHTQLRLQAMQKMKEPICGKEGKHPPKQSLLRKEIIADISRDFENKDEKEKQRISRKK